jgi:NADPH:quinone reductase-like Zn-dependent oxidoreductase
MDAIGGKSFKQSYSLLRAGGRLVAFGASSVVSGEKRSIPTALKMLAQTPRFNLIKQMTVSKAVIGLNMLTIWDSKGSLDEYIDPLQDWISAGKIRPVVAEAFALERGPDAHRFIIERKNVGKVVLTM